MTTVDFECQECGSENIRVSRTPSGRVIIVHCSDCTTWAEYHRVEVSNYYVRERLQAMARGE